MSFLQNELSGIKMIAERYHRIFDESLSTYVLKMRQQAIYMILPLISSAEKTGVPSFIVEGIFEPHLDNIEKILSEDDMKKVTEAIEELKAELRGGRQ